MRGARLHERHGQLQRGQRQQLRKPWQLAQTALGARHRGQRQKLHDGQRQQLNKQQQQFPVE